MDFPEGMAAQKRKSEGERELDPTTRRVLARLKKARVARGLSQAQVAEAAHVETSYVGLVERNERVPSLPVLFRLAAAVGLAPAELLAEAGPVTIKESTELAQLRALVEGWPAEHRKILLQVARQLARLRE